MLKNISVRWKLWFIIGVSVAALCVIGLVTWFSLNQIQLQWRTYLDVVEQKRKALVELRSHIGYGGVIHNQKNYVLRFQPEHFEAFKRELASAMASIEVYQRIGQLTQTEKNALDEIKNMLQVYNGTLFSIQQLNREGKTVAEIDAAIKINDEPYLNALNTLSTELVKQSFLKEKAMTDSIDSTHQVMVWTIVGTILVILGLGYAVIHTILRSLAQLTLVSRKQAAGDLSQKVEVSSRDELGVLAEAFNQMTTSLNQRTEVEQQARTQLEETIDQYLRFIVKVAAGDLSTALTINGDRQDSLTILGDSLNKMVQGLRTMTLQIREATSNISSAAAEILATATEQAAGANQQSDEVSQTRAALDEIRTTVELALTKARVVTQNAERTRQFSQDGQAAIKETIDNMEQIKQKVTDIADNILRLSERTQHIRQITATVDDLAYQSNLLALNASIEAARAGEYGRGFAVVALEVRNLAQQSREATNQVKAILNEIHVAAQTAVTTTTAGTEDVDSGVLLTEKTGKTISKLARRAIQSADLTQQIELSATQQRQGMEQIEATIENISQAVIQNLASTHQTEKAAQDLNEVAHHLEQAVAQYKLS